MPNMRAPLATIDANPWFVGLDQGKQLIDLQSGAIRIAQPNDLITKALGVATLGQATEAVRWQAFLNQVFQGDSELIDWLQRWCGYLLTGSTREQVLLFGYGLGANGKSVFAEVLRFIMGDYAKPMQSETLTETKRTAGGPSPDLADLVGARLALASETEDGAHLAESLVKSLTAGDALSVRTLYGTPFTFLPGFKLLILGNHKPVIRGSDHGIWRRILLVPFTRTFASADRDPELTAKLKAEAPHIVAWMLQGCLAWQARGLSDVPVAISSQTEEYRKDMDTLGQWMTECCNLAPEAETASGLLYQSYTNWCQANGVRTNSNAALGRRLSERGLVERRTKTARYRVGIALDSPMPFHSGQHHG
jgi:P4 family phage/plasmid primase-like protien